MNDSIQTRREFMRHGLTFLAAAYTVPLFLTRTAFALDQRGLAAGTKSIPGMPDDHILVVIQLGGGNDGLNTVVPYAMDEYYRARPVLAVPKTDMLKLNDVIGLHPHLAKLKALYDGGHVAVVQGVGYPNPDRSHFRSMEIWHTGEPASQTEAYGWLGRYLDNACPGCDAGGSHANPSAGINIGGGMPVAMKSAKGMSIAIDNPDGFRWVPMAQGQMDAKQSQTTFEKLNHVVTHNLQDPQVARLDFLSRVAMDAEVSSDKLREVLKKARVSTTAYPGNNGLAHQLQTVARLISGGMPTRVYYVSIGGFDTHSNQRVQQERLLTEFAEAVEAFYRDLEKKGEDQRVVTMSFSEFGRRVQENASGGTDHGAGAPMFVMGPRIKGGVYGAHPGLKAGELDRGDVKFHTDFRQVYATVLENWLGANAKPILGSDFAKLKFV